MYIKQGVFYIFRFRSELWTKKPVGPAINYMPRINASLRKISIIVASFVLRKKYLIKIY